MVKAKDFGPKIVKTPKTKIRLLNVGTYVHPYLANSFLSLACNMFGDTED